MLARVLAMALCLSVRLSVTSRCPQLYRNVWTDRAGFWQGAFFRPSLYCVARKLRYFENKATSTETFPKSGL